MRDGVIMKFEFRLIGNRHFGDRRNNRLHKCLWLNNKRDGHLRLWLGRWRLGTDADTRRETR